MLSKILEKSAKIYVLMIQAIQKKPGKSIWAITPIYTKIAYNKMKTLGINNKLNKIIYSNIIKKICFKYDEEKVHNFFTNFGRRAGENHLSKKIVRHLFSYQNPVLEQNLCGIT